ncbi:MAG: hypothetical protein IJD48_01870 [Clostridia bacterium]|nr:hypothetical protein [Clostridia bacterium]
MAIENRTLDFKSHKHKTIVYVDLNSKTKLGSDLIGQYHEQAKSQYIDIGRIGYHDSHGKYHIDYYTTKELIVVPKLIVRVTEKAMNRAGKDVYQLRTYMSKFGQLNFLLLVDQDKAELILVENVYISNLNHKEDYETSLWILRYHNQKPIPLAEIFYKFGIKANPEDYGKSWKDKVEINNILTSIAKADMTVKLAENIASSINQKALVASLNYLNKEGDYGQKITSAYSKTVANKKEINNLATSPKLENTLNHVLLKTIEDKTDKKDLKNISNQKVYKKVIDIQLSTLSAVVDYVDKQNTKENFKEYLLNVYHDDKQKNDKTVEKINIEHEKFEKIIDYKFSKKPNQENFESKKEEVIDKKSAKRLSLPKEFRDFDNNLINVDQNLDRFEKEETKQEKKERLKIQKEKQRQEKIQKAIERTKQKKTKRVSALCDIGLEFEKSKAVIGLTPEIYKKNNKKAEKVFEDKKQKKTQKRQSTKDGIKEKEDILLKLEKRVRRQTSKRQAKIEKRQQEKAQKAKRVNEKKERKQLKKDKEKLMKEYLFDKKDKKQNEKLKKASLNESKRIEKRRKKQILFDDRPSVKPREGNLKNAEQKKQIRDNHYAKHQSTKPLQQQNVLNSSYQNQQTNNMDVRSVSEFEPKKRTTQAEMPAPKLGSTTGSKKSNVIQVETSATITNALDAKNFDYSQGRTKTKHKEKTLDM